jgi:predicted transcriptional regulator
VPRAPVCRKACSREAAGGGSSRRRFCAEFSPNSSISGHPGLIGQEAIEGPSVAAARRDPGPEGATSTTSNGRKYRTQVEVLRDLLEAARRDRCKTRIIGHANLNEESFARYAFLALSEGLLERGCEGFRVTALAEEWLGQANLVLAKRAELDLAVDNLARVTRSARSLRTGVASPRAELWSPRLRARLSGTDLTLGDAALSGGHLFGGPRSALSLSHATVGVAVPVVAEVAPESAPAEPRGRRK